MSRKFTYYGSKSTGVSYFSDLFGMPTACYSLIKLTDKVGNCIRVRRSSDSSEQDFGFTSETPNAPLDTAAVLSFVGAGDGYVTRWYDQSTGNNHALNEVSDLSIIPQIVSSGTLITEGAIPAVHMTGRGHRLPMGLITGGSARASFSIVKQAVAGGVSTGTTYGLRKSSTPATGRGWNVSIENSALFIRVSGSASYSYPAGKSATDYSLISTIFNGTTVNDVLNWQNGVSMAQASASGATINTLGDADGALSMYSYGAGIFTGNQLCHILYGSDKAAQRAAIETYLNDYYGFV